MGFANFFIFWTYQPVYHAIALAWNLEEGEEEADRTQERRREGSYVSM